MKAAGIYVIRNMVSMQSSGATLKSIGLVFQIAAESSVHFYIKSWKKRKLAGAL